MGLEIYKMFFDTANPDDGANVGAYVRASDGTLITKTTNGAKEALDVNIANTSDPASIGIYAEDDAHVSGDNGQMVLGVRNDAGTLMAADGDYIPLSINSLGELRASASLSSAIADDAADAENPIKMGSHAYDQGSVLGAVTAGDKANLAADLYRRVFVNDSYFAYKNTAASVTTTNTEFVGTPLAGRKSVEVQNKGTKSVYLNALTGGTTATGMEIPPGSSANFSLGQACDIWLVAASGTQDVRIVEFA